MKKFNIFISILIFIFLPLSCTTKDTTNNYDIEYLDKLNNSLQNIISNIEDLQSFMKSSNLDDNGWILEFKVKINDITSSVKEKSDITFPDDKAELKKSYTNILRNLNTGLDQLKLSCQTKSIDDFNKGVQYINSSIDEIQSIDEKIK